MSRKLTKKFIDSIPPGPVRGKWYTDAELPGFFIVAYPDKKVFFARYRAAGVRKVVRIGLYGTVTPDEARAKARQHLAQAEMGGDPADDIRRKKEIPTVHSWVKEYTPRVLRTSQNPRNITRYLDILDLACGRMKLSELKPRDLERVREKLTPTTANRFLQAVSPCLNAAIREGFISQNPATGLRRFDENPPRSRVFSDDEMNRLFAAIDRLEDVHLRAAFYMLALTGARLSEVLHARWKDLDLEAELPVWRLPRPKSKTPQTVFPPAEVVAILKDLPEVGPFVIPGRKPSSCRADLKKPWMRLCREADLKDAGIHDLRRTFLSLASRQAGAHLASKVGRHSSVTITEKHYLPEDAPRIAAVTQETARLLMFNRKAS